MIYFMQSIDGGPVKVGRSGNVESRRRQHESMYGIPIRVLATMPGGLEEEQALLERFYLYRLGPTEQFRPCPLLMDFIASLPTFIGWDQAHAAVNETTIVDMMRPARPPVRLDLPPDLHQMLRVVAAEQGKPMAVFAREIVEKTVREMHGKRSGH